VQLKRIIISVTNDLSSDQRVNRAALVLSEMGYEVLLVGRELRHSPPVAGGFKCRRFKLFFNKGPLFYAEYNLRLFFYLLFKKHDLLLANDLDTLLANFIVSKLRKSELVYDSHEYYTEVPELQHRRFVRGVWERIERFVFPKLQTVYTVNDTIADIYREKYGVDVKVVRNIPLQTEGNGQANGEELNLPENKRILILQGAGINVDRGGEELVRAMEYVENAMLYIIGSGDVIPDLKNMTGQMGLNNKVIFIDRIPSEKLNAYTRKSHIGITIDKTTNLNYKYSLPNKLFDYIHAGIPILASRPIEVEKIIKQYNIGVLIDNHEPKHIADKINFMLQDEDRLDMWRENVKVAQKDLTWEKEKLKLKNIFLGLGE